MVVIITDGFHARARGSYPGLGGLKETKKSLSHPLVKLSIYSVPTGMLPILYVLIIRFRLVVFTQSPKFHGDIVT